MKYSTVFKWTNIHANSNSKFYILNVSEANVKSIAETTDYIKQTGRDQLLFQYSTIVLITDV